MLYQKYQKRIQTLVALRDWAWRFRLLLCASALSVAGVSVALVSVKGIVSDATPVASHIVYGEPLSYASSAVYGGAVLYEFASLGSDEWSSVEPKKVGTYQLRASSENAYGQRYYGKTQLFSIDPRPCNLTCAARGIYGETPSVTPDNLAFGDHLSSYQVAYEDILKESTSVTIVSSSVVIENAEGENVASCYTLAAPSTAYQFDQRALTITVRDQRKVYDGSALSSSLYSLDDGSLAEGDKIVPVFATSLTDVGVAANQPRITIQNASGDDVTLHYAITLAPGSLTIDPKPVTIVAEGASKVYDGAPLTDCPVSLANGSALIEGHSIKASFPSAGITHIGELSVTPTIEIDDAAGNNVSANYAITVTPGKLQVTSRPITIEAVSKEKDYDGTALTSAEYRIVSGSLAEGESLAAQGDGTILEVGQVNNHLTPKITNAAGEEVTGDYSITSSDGSLSVVKRKIEITTDSTSKVYDGKPLKAASYSLSAGSLAAPEGKADYLLVSGYPSATSYTATPLLNSAQARVYSAEGNDVSANYEITIVPGTLSITQRPLTLGLSDLVYSGLAQSAHQLRALAPTTLADGDSISATWDADASLRYVSDGSLTIANPRACHIQNSQGNDVSANYDIRWNLPTSISMRAMSIAILASTQVFLYDGTEKKPASDPSYVSLSNLGIGDRLASITLSGSQTEIGSSYIACSNAVIVDASGTDRTANYSIDYGRGMLYVTAKELDVQISNVSKVYDGTPATGSLDYSFINGTSLFAGDVFKVVSNSASETEVGTYSEGGSHVRCQITRNGVDVTNSYYINVSTFEITVTGRPLEITTGSASKIYDRTPLICKDFEITGGGLAVGDTLTRVSSPSLTEVGKQQNLMTFRINDAAGKDVTKNYAITQETGTLTISGVPLEVTTSSAEKTYDGSPLSNSTYSLTKGTLLSGDQLVCQQTYEVSQAGTYPNALQFGVTDFAGVDVSDHYDITVVPGSLVIQKRALTIQLDSYSGVYDGKLHSAEGYSITAGSLASGDTLSLSAAASFGLAGTYENKRSVTITHPSLGNVTTSCYDVTLKPGVVDIAKAPLTITTGSIGPLVYDGQSHSNEEITASGLIAGDSIAYSVAPSFVSSGNYLNARTITAITNPTLGDVASSYLVSYSYGSVSITKRPLTITTSSASKVYDGTPLSAAYTISSGSLAAGDSLQVISAPSLTRAGSLANKITFSIVNSLGEDVMASCYDVTMEYGTLSVTPEPLAITTGDSSATYNFEMQAGSSLYTVTSGTIYDTVSVNSFWAVDVARDSSGAVIGYRNKAALFFTNAAGEDVSSCYQVTYTYGTFTINPLALVLSPASGSKQYDGTTSVDSASGLVVSNVALPKGYQVTATIILSSAAAGTVVSTLDTQSIQLLNTTGEKVAYSNFTFSYQAGTFTILARPITLTGASYAVINGEITGSPDDVSVSIGQLANGDVVSLTYTTDFTKQTADGTYENVIASCKIVNQEGVDVTASYQVTLINGSVVVYHY